VVRTAAEGEDSVRVVAPHHTAESEDTLVGMSLALESMPPPSQ